MANVSERVHRSVPVGVGLLAAVAAGAIAPFLGDQVHSAKAVAAIAIAVPGAIVLTVVALQRFEMAMLVLLSLRLSLDGVKAGPLEPATAIGGLFIVASLLWLSGRAVRGQLRPASFLTRSLYALAAAGVIAALTSPYKGTAIAAASKVLAGALMWAVIEQLMPESPKLPSRLLRVALLSSAIPFLLALYQLAANQGNHDTSGFNRVYGTAVHPTSFASYLSVLIMLVIGRASLKQQRRRGWLTAWLAVAVLLLLATYTRAAWISVVLGGLYLIWRLRRSLLPVALIVGVALTLFVPQIHDRFKDLGQKQGVSSTASGNSLLWRWDYWHQVVPLAHNNPLTGIGLDTTSIADPRGLAPHNVIVQAYVEMGWLGLIALGTVIAAFWAAAGRRRKRMPVGNAEEKVLSAVMGAVGLVVLVQAVSSNILTTTLIYWYAAAAVAYYPRSSRTTTTAMATGMNQASNSEPSPPSATRFSSRSSLRSTAGA